MRKNVLTLICKGELTLDAGHLSVSARTHKHTHKHTCLRSSTFTLITALLGIDFGSSRLFPLYGLTLDKRASIVLIDWQESK